MSLDIRLRRAAKEPWGFRLIGGVDFEMPLTIVKVTPSSPAERYGLLNGDSLVSISGLPAQRMSHEEANEVIRSSEDELELRVVRGLYDPILDEQEPIFDQIDLEDSVLQSEPTEVLPPLTLEPIVPLNDVTKPTNDVIPSRSQTASPFVLPTKPYRPFSTEPILEVPKLEDPIILNPDYKDEFGSVGECPVKTKFKLPLSEQYDPDYGKPKKVVENIDLMSSLMTKEEILFDQQMSKELDLKCIEDTVTANENLQTFVQESLQNVDSKTETSVKTSELISKFESCEEVKKAEEKTVKISEVVDDFESISLEEKACFIVDESISKAVTVAEEIKKEIDVELHSTVDATSAKTDASKSTKIKEEWKAIAEEAKNVNKKSSTIESNTKTEQFEHKSVKMQNGFKESDAESSDNIVRSENKSSARQEMQETITSGTVKRLSSDFDKELDNRSVSNKKTIEVNDQASKTSRVNKISNSKETIESKNVVNKEINENKRKISAERLLAEQRAYTIGLQTIPKIRGNLHSSYQYNLLLKTFFIHLTDVMVALSRFILTDNALSKIEDSEVASDVIETVNLDKKVSSAESYVRNEHIKSRVDIKKEENENLRVKKEQEAKRVEEVVEHTEESVEKRKISGSKMAQLTEKKSVDLTNKMDAVISEFQTKAGTEESAIETQEKEQDLRTNTTVIEQEITKGVDPLDWLSKNETKTERHETFEVSSTETKEVKQNVVEMSRKEYTTEENRSRRSKSREGRNTYVAVVESHVYTNKDVVFDEQFSDSSSEKSLEAKTSVQQTSMQKVEDTQVIAQKESAFELKQETVCEKTAKEVENSIVFKEELDEVDMQQQDQEYLVEEAVKLSRKPSEIKNEDVEATVKVIKEIETSPIVEVRDFYSEEKTKTCQMETNAQQTELKSTIVQTQQSNILEQSQVKQESNLINEAAKKANLSLELNKGRKFTNLDSFPSTIETPTPATIPPTPLTDEYMFRLQCPLPKSRGITPIPDDIDVEEVASDHEEFGIVKKKLIPHIDTTIERVVYDPPLATPVEVKDVPSFVQNGLKTCDAGEIVDKEEILEIERKSSLLASAIDETIKSIEEYKEQAGIQNTATETNEKEEFDSKRRTSQNLVREAETNIDLLNNTQFKAEVSIDTKDLPENKFSSDVPIYAGYVKEAKTTVFSDAATKSEEVAKLEKQWSSVTSQVSTNTQNIAALTTQFGNNTEASLYQNDSTSNLDITKQYKSENLTQASKDVVTSNFVSEQAMFAKAGLTEIDVKTETKEGIPGYKSVHFNPDEIVEIAKQEEKECSVSGFRSVQVNFAGPKANEQQIAQPMSMLMEGETLGTTQGIISGMEPVGSEDTADLGKPGLTDEKIAELMSGESEMLREAHVMGLSRVLVSHMTRPDENSSVDFKKIKPTIETLKDSEVLKALNEELVKTKEEKKKEERKWTTFLQKPARPMPKAKFGYHGWLPQFDLCPGEEYKVQIVKQPKPKVAPDYKPEDFETGPLPWELRFASEPPPAPVTIEDPILIPEEQPEFLEAVDPLPESEVPDLEETGIQLPPEKTEEEVEEKEIADEDIAEESRTQEDAVEELDIDKVVEETEEIVSEMEQNKLAEQLLSNVQGMVDPNAPIDQQLAQMRAQLAALAQLPCVIQQSLELVTKQLLTMNQQESTMTTQCESTEVVESSECIEVSESQETTEVFTEEAVQTSEVTAVDDVTQNVNQEEIDRIRREEQIILEEQRRIEQEKMKLLEQTQLDHESRQVKQHPTPRMAKPKPMFGPLTPQERPMILPGGRKWRTPKDAYNDQFIAETLTAQAEMIQGKAKGLSFESHRLPYDTRVNFLKYEKPPISLDHLKDSDVYKMIHNMEDGPTRRVDMLTPVMAECDYLEKCRSITPCTERMNKEEHLDIPQQLQP